MKNLLRLALLVPVCLSLSSCSLLYGLIHAPVHILRGILSEAETPARGAAAEGMALKYEEFRRER